MKTGLIATTAASVAVVILLGALYANLQQTRYVELGNGQWPSFPANRITKNTSSLTSEEIRPDHFSDFYFGFYHGLRGSDELRVDANGEATYIFWRETDLAFEPFKATFSLQRYEIDELCRRLRGARFAQLPDLYEADVSDLDTIAMTLHCGEAKKKVICVTHYPPEIANLAIYLHQDILNPRQAIIREAQPISTDEAYAFGRDATR